MANNKQKPRRDGTIIVYFRLKAELKEMLHEEAEQQERSPSKLLNIILRKRYRARIEKDGQ